MVRIILIFLLLLIPFWGFSQKCANFQKQPECKKQINEKGFNYSGQSSGINVEVNDKYNTSMVLYGKRDYLFNFCTKDQYKPVHYKLLNTETQELIYDNTDDQYNSSVGFTLQETMSVTVECSVLAKNLKVKNFDENRCCLGILILYKQAPRLGF